jgi:hypothetical protein
MPSTSGVVVRTLRSRHSTGVVTAGAAGTVLTSNGPTEDPSWETPGASGDVVGPASATDNAIARFDTTTGKLLQNSGATIDDSGNLTANNVSGTHSGTSSGANSGDVTLAGSPNYLTIAGQVITRALIDLASHVTGRLPFANLVQVATQRFVGRNTAGTGNAEEVTLSQALDWIGSPAQGDILYRGAAAWARLGAGTAGQFLKTQGAAANPMWDDVSSSGGSGGGGHLHGLQRMLGDGSTTTFNLLDFAEYLEHVGVNGSLLDPLTVSLSADRSQITFDAAPGAGQVITLEYVMVGM